MIRIFFITTLFCFFNCTFKNNPVKMKIRLIAARFFIFFLIKNITSRSWLPFIFAILYLGGILIMFMILSSFLPNRKIKNNIGRKVFLWLALASALPSRLIYTCHTANLKAFIEEKINFIFITLWILGIFFGFILILRDCRISIRSMTII